MLTEFLQDQKSPFAKFWSTGKEEARTGWRNADGGPQKFSRKQYSLDQFYTARPYESCKYLRAGPAEMPFRNWYTANTNHFHLTDSVRWKSKRQLG